MLLSYTANIEEKDGIVTGFIYSLPIKYSVQKKENVLNEVISALSDELDSYLRAMIKRKEQFPLPYKHPAMMKHYAVPVALDIAFVMILKVYKSNVPQKDIAKKLGKSPAYLSTVESLDTGVTLANATEMLKTLGIKAALDMLPYQKMENLHFQYSPDNEKIPVATPSEPQNLNIYQSATHRENIKKNGVFPFPANIKRCNKHVEENDYFEVSFPDLEKYGLNIVVLDTGRERTITRAENTINMLLMTTDKKIIYPEKKQEQIDIMLNFDVVHKHFLKEYKELLKEK